MVLGHNADGDGVFSIPYRYLTLRKPFAYYTLIPQFINLNLFVQHETLMTPNNSVIRRELIHSLSWVLHATLP